MNELITIKIGQLEPFSESKECYIGFTAGRSLVKAFNATTLGEKVRDLVGKMTEDTGLAHVNLIPPIPGEKYYFGITKGELYPLGQIDDEQFADGYNNRDDEIIKEMTDRNSKIQ